MPLIERHHADDRSQSRAVYSGCESYRYFLGRTWDDGPRLLYIMLNPSKATELANDPTIERCERRARALGYGAVGIVNLFAWRETSPQLLRRADDPVGPDNDAQITAAVDWADHTLAAWGVHGDHLNRHHDVLSLLDGTPLFTLGLTKYGQPRHPLYVSYATPLQPWQPVNPEH